MPAGDKMNGIVDRDSQNDGADHGGQGIGRDAEIPGQSKGAEEREDGHCDSEQGERKGPPEDREEKPHGTQRAKKTEPLAVYHP